MAKKESREYPRLREQRGNGLKGSIVSQFLEMVRNVLKRLARKNTQ